MPCRVAICAAMTSAAASIADLAEEYEFLDADDRYRLIIDLGRTLDPMPDALKTDATLVRGCSASVWVYPTRLDDGRLHSLAASNAPITALEIDVPSDRAKALMPFAAAVSEIGTAALMSAGMEA